MLKLIYLSLKRMLRSKTWIIEGTEVASGEYLNLIYLGKEVQKNYITDLIFDGNCKEKYIEKKSLWPFIHLIKNLSRCSLIIIEGQSSDYRSDITKGEFFIPRWVHSTVDIPLVANNKSTKEDLRRIRKNRLEYVVVKEPNQFHNFFHNMYLPYIKNRHQDRMIPIGYDQILQRVKDETCELLFIKKDNEFIAGLLIVYEGDLPRTWATGIKDGDLSLLRACVGPAAYYFPSLHLKEQGYEKMSLGSSRAFLKNGVLQYKKKWGIRVFPHDTKGFILKPLSRSEGLKGFFFRNPFVFVSEGMLCGAVFIGDDTPYTDEIYKTFHKNYYMDGLDDLIVIQWGEKKNSVFDSYRFRQSQERGKMSEKEEYLEKASLVFVKDILHLEKGEKFLIYTDQDSDIDTAKAIQSCAEKNGVQTFLLEAKPDQEPEDKLKELLHRIEKGKFDAICNLSLQYFFLTVVWQKAAELGIRIYSLGGVGADAFIRCIGQAEQRLLLRFGTALAKILRKAKSVRILTEQGTHIECHMNPSSLLNRTLAKLRLLKGSSQMSYVGLSSTFMAGQVVFYGIPDTVEGTATIDGYLWPPEGINPIDEPIILKIKNGSVVEISGSPSKSEILKKWLDGKEKTIKHFCIGFNPGAELSGEIVEAERLFGSITVGFGKHPYHTDGIIKNASLLLNGHAIIKNGEFTHKDLSALAKDLVRRYTRREE